MEFFCLVGNLLVLKIVIDCGVDVVYIGFKDDINVCYFAGFNFSGKKFEKVVDYVYDYNKKIYIVFNIFVYFNGFECWINVVD